MLHLIKSVGDGMLLFHCDYQDLDNLPVTAFVADKIEYPAPASGSVAVATDTFERREFDGTSWNAPEYLPKVTEADNGKTLTVVDGAWAAAAPEE